jgi:hypothetical protein
MNTRSHQFGLKHLLAYVTAMAVFLGLACGMYRYINSVIDRVEREHWEMKIREGLDDPHHSPAAAYLKPEEIDRLVRERERGIAE